MRAPRSYADLLDEIQRVEWAFGLNLPSNPEGDGTGYVCPAEAYIDSVKSALCFLSLATDTAFAQIPENIKARGAWLEKSRIAVVEELATDEPEVRRLWAVRAAFDLVSNLVQALEDEAKPHPRVILPKLAKTKRHR